MASRNVEIVISARDNFTGTANKVVGSLNAIDRAGYRVGKGIAQVGMGLTRVAVIGATAAAGGLTAVAKKTIDWESALAGVNKTMDLTPGELQAIGTDIRKLATEIPLSANALAGLVEQAGALGIKKQDVLAFAEATATIGVTTNVAADQAASSLGILSNLLGLTGKDFERFGSSLVDLGNKGASTEDQILAIAERGAGAAATIGLAAEELLGWASAIANIGMEPEAAGTSFQRFALGVQKFTRQGGDELEVLAATAGTTAKEFARAFDEDASGALESFVDGLAKLKKGERLDVLTALGFDDARLGRMLLGLATAEEKNDNLTKSLNVSADAWRANTAAAEEADKRYGTTASKLALLNNQFTEGALLIGEGFLPALGRVADKLKAALGDEAVRNDLRSFGKDIGDAIDGIDFNKVLAAGREFVSLLKGGATVAMALFNAVNALPGPLKEAGLGFLVLNKLSGGLIGAGAGNIAGGLGETIIRAGGARLPGTAGRLFAQPVFVTNWPPGMGMGGPLGAAGKGSWLAGLFPAAVILGIGAAVGSAVVEHFGGELNEQEKEGSGRVVGAIAGLEIVMGQNTAALVRTASALEKGPAGPPLPPGYKPAFTGPTPLGPPTPPGMGQTFSDPGGRTAMSRFSVDAAILRGIEAGFKPTRAAAEATVARNLERTVEAMNRVRDEAARTTAAAQRTAFAIEHKEQPPLVVPAPQVFVNVSATSVTHKTIQIRRYGPTGGSREISQGGGSGPQR